ncbi:MAG: TIGR01777 family oxidoreductase [Flavobacteriaceae bacterium]|nr:TIGR01777 family oxidoreductase [Flavobacteriaceae bacterium]
MKKMILAGGSGYLGRLLIQHFRHEYDIFVLTRSGKSGNGFTPILWDAKTIDSWAEKLENADVLINLTGENINTSFTESNKKKILNSRIESTDILGKAVMQLVNPPKIWLNASAIAVYEESESLARDEYDTTFGNDFLAVVSRKWEETFNQFHRNTMLKAVFRISMILGDTPGSAYKTLKTLVRLGGGGKAGSGKQMVSWMGEQDFVNAIEFIIENSLEGEFNFCNPKALSNKEFMQELRKKMGVPIGIPTPEFLLKIGAGIIGTAPDLVLRSQNVIPKRLIENGFVFEQTQISDI